VFPRHRWLLHAEISVRKRQEQLPFDRRDRVTTGVFVERPHAMQEAPDCAQGDD
jgi:hypothetical protein